MSITTMETKIVHGAQTADLEEVGNSTQSVNMTAKEKNEGVAKQAAFGIAKGLGISTLPQVWSRDSLCEAKPTPPEPLETARSDAGKTSDYFLSEEYLRRQRFQQSRDRIAELRKRSKTYELQKIVTVEDRPAVVRNDSSSVDSESFVTGSSTDASTPDARESVSSAFSGSRSRSSRFDSTSSTPSESRSPSPRHRPYSANGAENELSSGAARKSPVSKHRKSSLLKRKDASKGSNEIAPENEISQSSDDQTRSPRKSTFLRKKSAIAVAGLLKSSISENEVPRKAKSSTPEMPPLPPSFSSDTVPTLEPPVLPSGRPSSAPRILISERANGSGLSQQKKKDELWNQFRTLDADYAKFASKSLGLKANVVRSSLLPFLSTYATHPSNRSLRLEDLDRRASILNKWWTGLIDLLHGRNNQSISGTDRPAILDGISGIMDRPEWRPTSSPFCPLSERTNGVSLQKNHSTTSVTSNSSDFLADSVHHNVRNIFVQNLTAQMAFVVDKMSLRNASASLVAFCGKACAYAFVFVPGMADVLARLWELNIQTLQRILQANGITKFDDMSSIANTVMTDFPPALHQLGLSTLTKFMRKLRTPPQLPVGTAHIPWWGHWLERWSGRESDLFYVFVKHFHILITEFLPSGVTKKARACAPGLLLVHAQILVNVDATLHRQLINPQQDVSVGGPSQTFDEMLSDPDATASTLPIPPANASRLMAENRLVVLIRDFLSEHASDHLLARRLFAESFSDLLQTAARGCGLFDHAASYTLLDFLEETLGVLFRFERHNGGNMNLIDFNFWMSVWKKMISSHNTMTEIRLYSFLYTVWNTVICESGRKADLCSEFLLDPQVFQSRFSHWCPTVRAYFMRLLCWRVARQDGDYSDVDLRVLEMLSDRLRTMWSYYMFLEELAEKQNTLLPTTNPCNPVPSRRLRIIRFDLIPSASRAFLQVDMLPVKDSNNLTPTALQRDTTLSRVDIEVRPGSALSNSDSEVEQRGRGFGGFIRGLMGAKTRSKSQNPSRSRSQLDSASTPDLPNGHTRVGMAGARPGSSNSADGKANTTEGNQQRQLSFKFALEYYPSAKPNPPMKLSAPRLPLPAQQFLETHSQKADITGDVPPTEPKGESKAHAKYCGQALAEWYLVLAECQSFFERRRTDGVLANKCIETPTLGVEVFRRPG